MDDNQGEQLTLKVSQTGAEQTANQLRNLKAAQDSVAQGIRVQDQAVKSANDDLDKLRQSVLKAAEAYDEMGNSADKAGKSAKESATDDAPKGPSATSGAQGLFRAAGRLSGESALFGEAAAFVRIGEQVVGSLGDVKDKGFGSIITSAPVLVGALSAASLVLNIVAQNAKKVQDAAEGEINEREKVIAFIQTASKEEIAAKLKEAQTAHSTAQAVANDANSVLEQTRANIKAQYGVAKAALAELDPLYGTIGPTLAAAKDAADKANKALDGGSTALSLLQQAAEAGVGSEVSYADAIKKTNEERTKATLASADEALQLSKKLADEQKLNSKQIQDRIAAIGNESAALESAIDVIKASGDTSAEAAKKLTEYQVAQGKLGAELTRLGDLKPIVANIEAETRAREYANQQQLDSIAVVKKYGDDVTDFNGKMDESKNKLVQTLDDIFANAQKAAENALQKAQQARADTLLNAARDEDKAGRDATAKRLDIVIGEQQQEVDTYKEYRRKLRDIQKNADEQSFELALNRDFSGLFNLNRNTDIQKNQATQDERDKIDDEREGRQRNLDDLSRSLDQERSERQIALSQRITDEVTAYTRERAQIEAQRKDAETKARAQAAREQQLLAQGLQTRQQTATAELNLIQQTEAQRLAITQAANRAYLAQMQQFLAAASSNSLTVNQTNNVTSGMNGDAVADLISKRTVQIVKQISGVQS